MNPSDKEAYPNIRISCGTDDKVLCNRKESLPFSYICRRCKYKCHPILIVETAKANNLNIFKYIYTLLLYMPGHKNGFEGMEQLLPWSDFIKEHYSGLIDVETVTVEEHPAQSV